MSNEQARLLWELLGPLPSMVSTAHRLEQSRQVSLPTLVFLLL